MGWSLSDFLNELDLRGQTWCIIECDDAGGFRAPPDDRLRFYAVLEGSARLAGASAEPICLEEREIAIVVSGHPHALRARPDSPAELLEFMREGSYQDVPPTLSLGQGGATVSRILCGRLKVRWPGGLSSASLPPVFTLGAGEGMVQVSDLVRAAHGEGAAGLLTRIAAVAVARALQDHAARVEAFPLSACEDPIGRAVQVIEIHPSKPWTVSMLARMVGMGRSNFASRFAASTGRTPMEMLAERRMTLAEELLNGRSQIKITEMAAQVGYRSEAAFIRRFVRRFGVTPGAMRNMIAESPDSETQ